jgi:menaquinone-dependent protoporphyrinogen oxidase
MAWLPPALQFLRRVPTDGAPVWVFSVGGTNPSGRLKHYVVGMEAEKVARGFPAGLDVRDHRVFGGVVVTAGLPLWSRVLARAVGGRPGDRRDWPAIEAWARQISGVLRARRPAH